MSTSDFLRLIAGGIIALVSSYVGILVKNGYKDNTKLYKDLIEFCDLYKGELSYEKATLIDIISRFCANKKGKTADIFKEYAKDMQSSGQFFRDVEKWNVAHLKKEQKQEILDFLNGLGKSGTTEQMSFVNKHLESFSKRKKQAEEDEKKKGNMFFKLFVLLGIALMVIVG